MSETVVLAYSGSLESRCILRWLKNQGKDVIAVIANLGQSENFEQLTRDAQLAGASQVLLEDVKEAFLHQFALPALAGNALITDRYLSASALSCPAIAKAQAKVALSHKAHAVAHAASGHSTDQVRLELAYASLCPDQAIIAPQRDPAFTTRFVARKDWLSYAESEGLSVSLDPASDVVSEENVLQRTYMDGALERPDYRAPDSLYRVSAAPQMAPDEWVDITLQIREGKPVQVVGGDGRSLAPEQDSVALFSVLNRLGAEHGVGRIDRVVSAWVGPSKRVITEMPGALLVHLALRDLESLLFTAPVHRLRTQLSATLTEAIDEGRWFSLETEMARAGLEKGNALLNGEVTLRLYRGAARPVGRQSLPLAEPRDKKVRTAFAHLTGFIAVAAGRTDKKEEGL